MAAQSRTGRKRFLVPAVSLLCLVLSISLFAVYPHSWLVYTAYTMAAIGWPLISMFFLAALLGLSAVGFLRYRRKSQLLAASLLLSVAMHLLMVSFFSFWMLSRMVLETVNQEERHQVTFGLPSLVESAISQTVRQKLRDLKTADERRFKTRRRSRKALTDASRMASAASVKSSSATPSREKIEVKQVSRIKSKVPDQLANPSEARPETTTMKVAMLQQAKPQPRDTSNKQKRGERKFETNPAVTPDMPERDSAPDRLEAKLKNTDRSPIRQQIEPAARRSADRAIDDELRAPAPVKSMDKLALRVEQMLSPAGQAKPATPQRSGGEISLSRTAAAPLDTPSQPAAKPQIADSPATLPSSLAGAAPRVADRQPEQPSPAESIATDRMPLGDALRRMSDAVATMVHSYSPGRTPSPSRATTQAGRASLTAAKAATGVEQTPALTTRPALRQKRAESTADHASLLRGSAASGPRRAQPSVNEGTLVAASVTAAPDTGRMESVTASTAPLAQQKSTAGKSSKGTANQRGQTRLDVGKAGRETEIELPGAKRAAPNMRSKTTGHAATLVVDDIGSKPDMMAVPQAVDSGDGGVQQSSAAASPQSTPLRIAARTLSNRAASPGRKRQTRSPTSGSMRVPKAAGTAVTEESGDGNAPGMTSAMGVSATRSPTRMDVSASRVGAPDIRVSTDISGDDAARPGRAIVSAEIAAIAGSPPRKAIYKFRAPEERRRLINQLGGSAETEGAVEAALSWLAKAQSTDGRWDVNGFKLLKTCGGAGDRADGDVAVTGLSLLAYLGAGYTHARRQHKETVRKGLEWLISGQTSNGDLRRGGQMYGHAMATAALCESYSLSGDKQILPAAKKAVKFIMNAQNPGAAWRYQPRDDNDTSVAGWQILALKSAEISGIDVNPKHYAWMGQWLDKVRKGEKGGLYAYKEGHGPTRVMTAEGWFCQLFMREGAKQRGREESIDYIMDNLPRWEPSSRGGIHLYYWYYGTLALYLSGADEFGEWNVALSKALLEGRVVDGPAAGSWDPVCQLGERGGRIYATAISALCLEVYYRYLPFYKQN